MSIAKALLEVQRKTPAIDKDAEGTVGTRKYPYLSLDHLLAVVVPILNEEGVLLAQLPIEGGVETRLIHPESGETLSFVTPLVMSQETSQAHGSAISYSKRYALTSVLGISGEKDDDGAAASAEPRKREPKASKASLEKPEKLREDLLAACAYGDTIRQPPVEPETTWNELVKVAVEDRKTKLSEMDAEALTLLGTELREYLEHHATTGLSFWDYATVKF